MFFSFFPATLGNVFEVQVFRYLEFIYIEG